MVHMKNEQYNPEFALKDMTPDELIQFVNREFPIKFTNKDIVQKVQDRYPLIPQSEVNAIIIAMMESFREFLLRGGRMDIPDLATGIFLRFYSRLDNDQVKVHTKLKVIAKTARAMNKK